MAFEVEIKNEFPMINLQKGDLRSPDCFKQTFPKNLLLEFLKLNAVILTYQK